VLVLPADSEPAADDLKNLLGQSSQYPWLLLDRGALNSSEAFLLKTLYSTPALDLGTPCLIQTSLLKRLAANTGGGAISRGPRLLSQALALQTPLGKISAVQAGGAPLGAGLGRPFSRIVSSTGARLGLLAAGLLMAAAGLAMYRQWATLGLTVLGMGLMTALYQLGKKE
jgi:hypothetical protein